MSEIKIPNLNNRSRQFLFKNKLTIKRKSKKKLLSESILMLISSFILIFLNYLIPQKKILFYSFLDNIYQIYLNFLNFFKYFYQILLVIFIILTLITSTLLLIGSLYRIYKVLKRKTRKFNF